MKNKRGFTLVELLAVVVVLGIIGTIASLSVIQIKRKAADDVFKKLEQEIADLGPAIYSHELLVGGSTSDFINNYRSNSDFVIMISELSNKGYIDEVKSPYNKDDSCSGYLLVRPNSGDDTYKAYLNCGGTTTDGYDTITSGVTISNIK